MKKVLKSRNPGLDVLRSLCLFAVLLQHSFLFTDKFYPQFRHLWILNNASLDLFFILSGFLIAGILEKKYNKNNSITISNIFNFYKRRWYKTVPMYFLIILICLLLSHYNIYYAQDFSWKFLFFLQNVTIANFHFLPHTYSLTIEEWFYIFFPILFYIILKFKLKVNPFYITIFIWIFTVIIIRMFIHFNGVENWDGEIRKSLLSRIDATIYGVLLYFINIKHPFLVKKNRLFLLISGFSLYLACTFIMNCKISPFYNNVLYYSLIPFFISFLLPFFIHLRLPLFFEKIFTFQSQSSYSIYLIHLPLFYIIHDNFNISSKLVSIFLVIISIILSYTIGFFFYLLIEKPIMDLRDK